MYYRMYYPGLPASCCTDDLACPRLIARYKAIQPSSHSPSSRGYLANRAAYLKRTFAMTSLTQAFPGAKKPASAYTRGLLPLTFRRR